MDTLQRFSVPNSLEGFKFGHGSGSVYPNPDLVNGFKANRESTNPVLIPSKSDLSSDSIYEGSEGDGLDFNDCNNPALKYISDILLEEDLEGKPCMMQDCLALQAAEKSFYDVLIQKDPLPNSDDDSLQSFQNSNGSFAFEKDWVWDPGFSPVQSSHFESLSSTLLVSDSLSEMQSLGNFGGLGDASMFLPNPKLENFDLERFRLMPQEKKNHQREDSHFLEEGRGNKQSAATGDDFEPEEMFDKVLLGPCENHESELCAHYESLKTEENGKLQRNKQSKGLKATRSKRQSNIGEVVDLCTMLTQCAQAVANFDQRTASEILKEIRKHASPMVMQPRAADILKAYQVYITACPYGRMLHFFANRTIMKLAEKATRLHIIDFGISYGFQWPCLIQRLSQRPGGPPKLRITAIELPQPGFRPTERVEETGRRLEKYAKRFNVPFEYHVIAQKWETIRIEDIKIDRSELIVVNCLNRLRNIPDETVMVNSPRDCCP
ncbi:hypothetical protein M0R45_017215 [Rubus argutus]|uniref:Scarecrow-like protein 14 n=1 Tax=Rubus argutus TaxID=59490 RepID=A0AAW1XU91_RUBAR